MKYFEVFIRFFLSYISLCFIIFRFSFLFEFYYFETIAFFRIKYINFYLNFISYLFIRFLLYMTFFKYIVVIYKARIKIFIKIFIIIDRIIIRETIYNISRIILSILIISNRYRFRARFVKKTSFKIINFDIIKKTFLFSSSLQQNKFRDFQNFQKRYLLIDEIFNKIIQFENYFDISRFIKNNKRARFYYYYYRYLKIFSLNFEKNDESIMSFFY